MNSCVVRPLHTAPEHYDLLLCTVGYEQRARFIAGTREWKADRKIACGFSAQKVLEYERNREWFHQNEFDTIDISDSEFRYWLRDVLSSVEQGESGVKRLCIDVSSLSRLRIALLIQEIRTQKWRSGVEVEFLYSLAQFARPAADEYPNTFVGPVIDELAGWTVNPDRPPIAIVGLGYEQDRALGAVEHLEPAEVWLFTPQSGERQYQPYVRRANAALLRTVRRENRIGYTVEDPLACFEELESLCSRSLKLGNTLLLPFGPKIFALLCVLVACIHEQASVWRVSGGVVDDPVNRIPNGIVTGVRGVFSQEGGSEVKSV